MSPLVQQTKSILKKIKHTLLRQHPIPITTYPKGKEPKGRVLVSYLTDAVFHKPSHALFKHHSNLWECKEIVRIFNEKGYIVDTINFFNAWFLPKTDYDIVFDIYTNLQRFAPFLRKDTIKILHMTGSYSPYQNHAELQRVSAFEKRKKHAYSPKRLVANLELANRSLHLADHCSLIGNEHTLHTYPKEYHKKTTMIPVTTSAIAYQKNNDEYIPEKREFLWFFGPGAVHKGLDLVIDFFAKHQNLTLHIVGPIEQEKDFFKAYEKEFSTSPNIHFHGRLTPSSTKFIEIVKNVFCFIAPSCSEGISPACTTCLKTGLFPIVSKNTGISLPADSGIYLETCSQEEIASAIHRAYNMDTKTLSKQIHACQAHACRLYSKENFTQSFTLFLENVLHKNRKERS